MSGRRAGRCAGGRPVRGRRRAALLLEVLIALTILAAALGLLGAQLVAGVRMLEEARTQVQAATLADRMLALLEVDLQVAQLFTTQTQAQGPFGDEFPGWFWRTTIEPAETPQLGQVTVEILHQPDPARADDIDSARVVRALHLLRAAPARIDLAQDFGFDEDELVTLVEALPVAVDPSAFDPQQVLAQDPALLLEALPALLPLLQRFTGGGLPPGVGPLGAAGLSDGRLPADLPPELAELIRQQLGAAGLPGDAPPRRGGQTGEAGPQEPLSPRGPGRGGRRGGER